MSPHWPWDAIHEVAESLDLAYSGDTPPGQVDPGALVELTGALQRAMEDATADPRVQAVSELVGSVAAARLLTADRKILLSQVDDLREQVAAERAFMRATASEMGSEVARLTVALGEAAGHTGQLTTKVEAIAAGRGAA